MAEVRRVQPQSLDELKLCVENYAKSLSKNQINKSVAHIFKRAQCCIAKQGGSFEALLKKRSKIMEMNSIYMYILFFCFVNKPQIPQIRFPICFVSDFKIFCFVVSLVYF